MLSVTVFMTCLYERRSHVFFSPGTLHMLVALLPFPSSPCTAFQQLTGYLESFGSSSVSLSFSLLCALLFTHFGETSMRENLFPPIFWHKQKIYAKKKLGEKSRSSGVFPLFTASILSRPPGPPAVPGVFIMFLPSSRIVAKQLQIKNIV